MALSMTASSLMGSKVTAPQRTAAPRRAAAPVSATLRSEVARFAKAAGVSAVTLGLALSAQAAEVKLGQDSGNLAFDPPSITIKAGESVTWKNNAGFPHNVVFDEDDVPSGVNAESLSHEDYLNAKGETVTTTFKTPGTYGYYCEPHQGAGMAGKVIVQ